MNLLGLVTTLAKAFSQVAVCLDGLLEENVVESYNSQVYYLLEHLPEQ